MCLYAKPPSKEAQCSHKEMLLSLSVWSTFRQSMKDGMKEDHTPRAAASCDLACHAPLLHTTAQPPSAAQQRGRQPYLHALSLPAPSPTRATLPLLLRALPALLLSPRSDTQPPQYTDAYFTHNSKHSPQNLISCRGARNRTGATSTPWMRTTTIRHPVLLKYITFLLDSQRGGSKACAVDSTRKSMNTVSTIAFNLTYWYFFRVFRSLVFEGSSRDLCRNISLHFPSRDFFT